DDAALGDLTLPVVEREHGGAAVDEVELVLCVVEVVRPFVVGRKHERVDAECGDAKRRANLAKAVALAQRVEGGDRVAKGQLLTLWPATYEERAPKRQTPKNNRDRVLPDVEIRRRRAAEDREFAQEPDRVGEPPLRFRRDEQPPESNHAGANDPPDHR